MGIYRYILDYTNVGNFKRYFYFILLYLPIPVDNHIEYIEHIIIIIMYYNNII